MRPFRAALLALPFVALPLVGCASSRAAEQPGIAQQRPSAPRCTEVAPCPAGAFAVKLHGETVQGGLVVGSAASGPNGVQSLTIDGQPVERADDGAFIIGFDRDAPPTARLRYVVNAPHALVYVYQDITVAPRAWAIEELPIPRGTTPTPAFLKLRGDELARIAAARAIRSATDGWRQTFLWPVTGRISGLFGAQRVYRGEKGAYHSGVDIARPAGTPVLAPADGVVILAADRPFSLEGNLLMVDHGMGLNSSFLHLSRIDVKVGDRVTRGQPLGAIGMTGRATGPHLHWGMKWRDARIDPLLLAGGMPQ